jgi:signal transduction histidine kinase
VARLGQALGNLLGNAVQHGGAGGRITVTVRGGDSAVTIAVHNGGAAIPAGQLDGIFNPMKARQTPRPAAERGPTASLGLGLYIAERIVVAHGGRLAVSSSDAAGTVFTVDLPRDEPHDELRDEAPPTGAGPRPPARGTSERPPGPEPV